MMSNQKDKSAFITKLSLFFAVLFVIQGFFPLFSVRAIYWLYPETKSMTLNEVGDFVGGITGAFWALAGVIVIYIAFVAQMRQMALQENEVKFTREELREQKEQMIQQSETMKLQRFESTFFQLLSNHKNISNDIEAKLSRNDPKANTTRDYFEKTYNDLKMVYSRLANTSASEDKLSYILGNFQKFMELHNRNFYYIIRFIDRVNIPDKDLYVEILHHQLSYYQVILIFYDCAICAEEEKVMLEKYHFFKYIKPQDLLDEKHASILYNESAFAHV